MRNYYLDISKICFGVGFYGCLSRIDTPKLAALLAISSLVMAVIFGIIGYYKKEKEK